MSVETILYVAFATATAASVVTADRARSAQNKAERRARRVQQASADIENRRRTRQAIQRARAQRAQLQAAALSQNTGTNSAVSGALGSITTQTSSNIGAGNTQLAATNVQNRIFARGAEQASRFQFAAQAFGAIADGSIAAGQIGLFSKKPKSASTGARPT